MLSIFSLFSLDNVGHSRDYKLALEKGQSYLSEQFHRDDKNILPLLQQRSHFIDEILITTWKDYCLDKVECCLIAIGGYGRHTLHPYSDIDLLLLVDDTLSAEPPEALSSFLTTLWDTGLDIGYSVRTISECIQCAKNDTTIATTLLETRLLCGDTALYQALQQQISITDIWDTASFYQKKYLEQQQRHRKHNETANNLEPNIKESPGGLRDLHIINWISQRYYGVKDFSGLYQKGFLTQSEYRALIDAQDFLWRIRFALHLIAGRKQEVLTIEFQRQIATLFNYQDDDSHLAVEYFMKEYYLCALQVQQLNILLLQLFKEECLFLANPTAVKTINCRFQLRDNYIETINASIFAFYPSAMLELFLIIQQHPEIKGIRASTIRQLHAHKHLIDHRFRHDIKHNRLFMALLHQPHQFRLMNQLGILGAYLPAFGKIVGQMQHDLFHAYTVDEHTLFLVANLHRFSSPAHQKEFPLCSQIFDQIPKPELLYLAGLFHDIAKGRGGDHSRLGVVDATHFCQQHRLSQFDTNTVTFLVRHHLTMSSIAQREDISDPIVIKRFGQIVGSMDNLNYLYLLTVADIRATNRNLWNAWRDSLLQQLYQATYHWLTQLAKREETSQQRALSYQQQALTKLKKDGWPEESITALWQSYDTDYFIRHSIQDIYRQTGQRLRYPHNDTIISIQTLEDDKTLDLFILTKDKPYLFAIITHALEALQLNLLNAKINVTSQKDLLCTMIVNGPDQSHQQITTAISQAIQADNYQLTTPDIYISKKMTLFKNKPVITFQRQQRYTYLTIYTHDRPGLVSTIAKLFVQLAVHIITAKLTTLINQVEDVFFITNAHYEPLSKQQENEVEKHLHIELDKVDI
ncbi:MAG TPA: [protein-PII] uridylyltransferase [Gammaproteobacteria bacterium]|nr:[protein-PII] uridylyltransferase [Gammaproteobacteria bacterium]